jgi:hypothetical protein
VSLIQWKWRHVPNRKSSQLYCMYCSWICAARYNFASKSRNAQDKKAFGENSHARRTRRLLKWRQFFFFGELRGDIGAFQKIPITTLANCSARRCNWRYISQAGVWNCRILNHVVVSQLFPSLWNIYTTNSFLKSSSIKEVLFQPLSFFLSYLISYYYSLLFH